MSILIKNLDTFKLFKNLTADKINNLLKQIDHKDLTYTKGQLILDTYTNANYIGIILFGKINIEKLLPSGKSILMYSKSKGDILGEVASFSDAEFYPCNAIAINNTRIIMFKKSDFFSILTADKQILENFLSLVCNKAFSLNSHIGSLSFTSVKQKIAESILDYANENNSCIAKIPFNKKVWADRLNISRASLYRELDALCKDLVISIENSNLITILDKEKLQLITLN